MNDQVTSGWPRHYEALLSKCRETGFDMPSDLYIGSLLKTLVMSKPGGKFLELGTGIGLSLSWMIDGMDEAAELISIDNDAQLTAIVNDFFGQDMRIKILCEDGSQWIKNNQDETFDLIFADAWPGKYSELEQTLGLLSKGGFYVVDDLLPQPNWPKGHQTLVNGLIEQLEKREGLQLTRLNWSTGIIIAVRK